MYAILDIETTGGKYNEEGITEIAIHKYDGEDVVDRFISLINPEKEIQPFVVNLTGINNKMLRTAPKFHEVAKRIVEITDGCVLVAHNAQFDYRILRTEFRRLGYDFERKSLCTVDLSKLLLPDAHSYSLGKLVRSLGIPVSDRHRANGDALATLKLFKLLLNKDSKKEIIQQVIRKEGQGELSERQLDLVNRLPNDTGIFYLHNKDGEIIYLSKSRDIKKKVNQLFTQSGDNARKMVKETKDVTYERSGSELMAALKELQELQKIRPKFNHVPRKKMFTHTLAKTINEQGYMVLGVVPHKGQEKTYGRFKGDISAKNHLYKITQALQLCDKLNGFSEAKKNCAKYTEGNCNGACLAEESVLAYNERASKALLGECLGQKTVLLLDKGRSLGERAVIMVKNGSLVGMGYVDLNHQLNNIPILENILTPMNGTDNAHFIIESFLRKTKFIKEVPF
jgi:DNA polymerase III subunit epsilon